MFITKDNNSISSLKINISFSKNVLIKRKINFEMEKLLNIILGRLYCIKGYPCKKGNLICSNKFLESFFSPPNVFVFNNFSKLVFFITFVFFNVDLISNLVSIFFSIWTKILELLDSFSSILLLLLLLLSVLAVFFFSYKLSVFFVSTIRKSFISKELTSFSFLLFALSSLLLLSFLLLSLYSFELVMELEF